MGHQNHFGVLRRLTAGLFALPDVHSYTQNLDLWGPQFCGVYRNGKVETLTANISAAEGFSAPKFTFPNGYLGALNKFQM